MFCVKILACHNIAVRSVVCGKLSVSKMHGATIKIITVTALHSHISLTQGNCFLLCQEHCNTKGQGGNSKQWLYLYLLASCCSSAHKAPLHTFNVCTY